MSEPSHTDPVIWRPPEPVESSGTLLEGLVRASVIVMGAVSLFLWLSPSLIRGATRSDRLRLENRRAEIDRMVASASEDGAR